MSGTKVTHRPRLDELVIPGWASLSSNIFRYGGIALAVLLELLGLLSGGFFLVLTSVLSAVAAIGGWSLSVLVSRQSWYLRPNAKPLTAVALVALPVAFVAFAQIVGPLLTPPPTLNQQLSGQLSPGQEQLHTIAVDPRLTGMSLSISVTPTDGSSVRWFFQDPSGQSQWSGRTDQLGNTASQTFAPAPGQWTLHVIDDTGTAGYTATWQGWTSTGASAAPCPDESPGSGLARLLRPGIDDGRMPAEVTWLELLEA